MIELLKEKTSFESLIELCNKDPLNQSFLFEIAFAYWMTREGYPLKYERNANPKNNSSVDFSLYMDGCYYFFELLRVENSEEIDAHIKSQQEQDSLFKSFELMLSSDHENPYFRTAAQQIRLQEKLLEKGQKFPCPEDHLYSIIVCDCSNLHQGMLDEEDIRIAMCGKSQNPAFQEYWNGKRLLGMFEENYKFRNSEDFKKRVSCVIFIPSLKPDALAEGMFAINPLRKKESQKIILKAIRNVKPLKQLKKIELQFRGQ